MFLLFNLLMVMYHIDLYTLKNPCIPGINHTLDHDR